ncbi:MAG: hypothetical protein OXT74_14945, partial [Candidatus Poribacteria bacterium]|nr:hypothetical protein [Candidatus Poribacteria bacterium]
DQRTQCLQIESFAGGVGRNEEADPVPAHHAHNINAKFLRKWNAKFQKDIALANAQCSVRKIYMRR